MANYETRIAVASPVPAPQCELSHAPPQLGAGSRPLILCLSIRPVAPPWFNVSHTIAIARARNCMAGHRGMPSRGGAKSLRMHTIGREREPI